MVLATIKILACTSIVTLALHFVKVVLISPHMLYIFFCLFSSIGKAHNHEILLPHF